MKRYFRYYPLRLSFFAALVLAGFAACLSMVSVTSVEARQIEKKQILLLNSYHQNFSWNEEIFRGLDDVLRPKKTGIILHVEYMDTKRVEFNEHYVQQLRAVFEHKYKGMKLDLIMVTDNNAFEFMRRYHSELFPDVPVVFCGVNFYRDKLIEGHPLFTGVAENEDAKGTLWCALRLHPETKSIFIINDYTSSGRAIANDIRTELKTFAPSVTVRYSDNLSLPELLDQVAALPKHTLILYGSFYRDKDGRFYDVAEGVAAVSSRSKVPVYGLVDFDLGHGIVGGMLSSGYSQGQSMAQIALHVLAGRHPKDIPVIREGVSTPMFDYKQIKKYHIDLEKLPDDSEIINRPSTFYTENLGLIWLGVGFATLQMIIILALVVNTTRRKRAEKELRRAHRLLETRVRERTSEMEESEEALRTVFNSSHDAIFIHDVRGHILEVNERMLKMYNLTKEELGGLSIARDISSRDNAVYRLSSFWRTVINGEPQWFEWRARRPHDGSEFDVEVYLNRIVYRGREAILANVRDITVRKESENRIRQSLSKFEAILENSLVGIAMSRKRKFVTINRRGAEILGYSPDELIGNEISILLDSCEATEDFVQTSREALGQSGEFNTEQAFRNKKGVAVWCRMYAKAVDSDSLDKGIIWAWDDITEHRRAQEDLIKTREDAEVANRAKSEFLAAMSHEIRTPMNAIVGMTDITLQTDLSDDQRDYLKTVMDSAQHLLSIINDILDLSKIEARKLELDRIDFDLPFHVRTTIKGLEMQARQKGLDMILSIDDNVPECIKGDPLSLRQVLMNLVGNAIKFTHKGSVSIRVSSVDSDTDRGDDPRTVGLFFEVEDTGIGIPEEFIETIFQSFSQTTRAFGGTGLGLAICKQLISLIGGDIFVQSKVGRGSVFSFTTWYEPGVSCPVPTESSVGLPEAPPRPIKILIAEDNDVNVMVTTLRLEEMGYTYAVAGTGLEVLELLKREHFDIVLMDIEMPVLDGISATKAIRSAIPGGAIPDPAIPIVGVTAHALKEFRDKSLAAGMDDYVPKPVDFRHLSGIINRLVGGSPRSTKENKNKVQRETLEAKSVSPNVETLSVWMPDKAMENLGVDESVFKGFLETARNEIIAITEELEQAFEVDDFDAAIAFSHTIRSICVSIGANGVDQASVELESAFREGKSLAEPFASLSAEVRRLLLLMQDYEEV